MISSRRHFVKFYLALAGLGFYFLALASIIFIIYRNKPSSYGGVFMALAGVVLVFLTIYAVFKYFRNVPTIEVNNEYITFNGSDTFFWKDLEKIEMTGKRPFKFLGRDRKEGVLLRFKDQTERYIFDDMYSNSAELKSFIQQVIIDKKPFKTSLNSKILVGELSDQIFIYYKGLQVSSMEAILLYLFELPTLYFLIKEIIYLNFFAFVGVGVFGVCWFLFLGFRFYYFGVSKDYLLIRLHNVFWFKEAFRLVDIKEIVFEQKFKMPVALRVITNNFESKTYLAATLSHKKWLKFKDDLESKNVKVRNECINTTPPEPFEFKLFQ